MTRHVFSHYITLYYYYYYWYTRVRWARFYRKKKLIFIIYLFFLTRRNATVGFSLGKRLLTSCIFFRWYIKKNKKKYAVLFVSSLSRATDPCICLCVYIYMYARLFVRLVRRFLLYKRNPRARSHCLRSPSGSKWNARVARYAAAVRWWKGTGDSAGPSLVTSRMVYRK